MVLVAAMVFATDANARLLQLSWTDNAFNEDGFSIERSTGTSGEFAQVGVAAANVTTYLDTTVEEGTNYCYRVRAFNGAGFSTYSNVACGTVQPLPPFPTLTLKLNQDAFRSGDTMSLWVTLIPGSTVMMVDVYVVVRLPDGSFESLLGDGRVSPGIVLLGSGNAIPYAGEIFRYTFNGNEAEGGYAWLAALTQAGTLTLIGTIDEQPFVFAP